MVGLMKKKQRRILRFKMKDWANLGNLLRSGYTFVQCLELMNYDSNEVLGWIQEGKSMEEILCLGQKGKFYQLLDFFMKMTSLHDAIKISLALYHFEKKIKQSLLKQTAYPIFIFLFSFLTIYMFSSFIIPQLLANFDVDGGLLFQFVLLIRQVMMSIMGIVGFTLLLCLLLHLFYPFKVVVYRRAIRFLKILQESSSFYMSCYLAELYQLGLSTKEAFSFLNYMNKRSILYLVASDINHELYLGEELSIVIQASNHFSKAFKTHYMIGSSTNQYLKSLNEFRHFQEQKWMITIKHTAVFIQVVSYSLVGLLVLCVYQIMLIPLQILENL